MRESVCVCVCVCVSRSLHPGGQALPLNPSPPHSLFHTPRRHHELQVLGDDVIIDPDIPGPIYGLPNVPGKDQIGLSGPSWTMRRRSPEKKRPMQPGPGERAHGCFALFCTLASLSVCVCVCV